MYLASVTVLLLITIKSNFAIIVDSNNCIDFDRNIGTICPNVVVPQMRYYLFTRNNLIDGQEIKDKNVASVLNSNFNALWPVRIYIGDWRVVPANCKTALIKDAYLNLGDFNFIIADWSDWSLKDYIPAFRSVNDVGVLLGEFTKFLSNFNINLSDMYLIGQGMGAHVAGSAGSSIAPDKYDTIYALDAVGLGFSGAELQYRLDPSDANYVEAIFTDMFLWGYSSYEPLGHAQFFPNNGVRKQPYCPFEASISQTCSHTASIDYFANSLKPSVKFCSTPTTWNDVFLGNIPQIDPSCTVTMGGEPSIKNQGNYYVPTSNSEPLPP